MKSYTCTFFSSNVQDPHLLTNKARLLNFVIFHKIQKIYIYLCKIGKDTSRTTHMSEELLRNQIWKKQVTVKHNIPAYINL